MASVYDLCLLSAAVYDTENGAKAGKSGQWIAQQPFGNPGSGFYAVFFQRGFEGVLAIRGTDFTQGSDLGADIQLAVGSVPHQFANSETALQGALKLNANRPMYVTGHSLGGGLASLLAAKHALPTVTFNAPGMMRSRTSALGGPSPTAIAVTSMGMINPGMMYAPAMMPVMGNTPNDVFQQVKQRDAARNKAAQLDTSKMLNIRAADDVVSVSTGPAIGRVETIVVPRTGVDAGLGVAKMLSPIVGVLDGPWHAFQQHRIANVLGTVEKTGKYKADLGWLPVAPPAPPPRPALPGQRKHTVAPGESLSKVALKYYGDASKWTLIYAVPANRAVIGGNPNMIRPGVQLQIP